MNPTQQEILTPSPLLDAQGRLTQVGWARAPLLDCNLERHLLVEFDTHRRPRVQSVCEPLWISGRMAY